MSFKTIHTKEERDEWIEELCFDLKPLLEKGEETKALNLYNERSGLGFVDAIVAVHEYRDRLVESGEIPKRGIR